MSYYAVAAQLLPFLTRTHFGAKIEGADGQKHDTGVQEFVSELIAALTQTGPIQLADTLTFVAPPNGQAFQIIGGGNGDGEGEGEGGGGTGVTGSVQVVTGVTVTSVDTSGLTVDTSGLSVNTSGMDVSIAVDGCDVTATLTGSAVLAGSAVVSGTVVVTLNVTYTTLSFVSGLFVGAS